MNTKFIILFFIFSLNVSGQQLHHQMISSQGTTKITSSGIIVRQTIGQQSVSGTQSNGITVQQGFQQSYWGKLIAEAQTNNVSVIAFPNPYTELINFQFSISIDVEVSVSVFDINGRLVYSKSEKVVGTLLTLDLPQLSSAPYLVKLSSPQFNYLVKIIKI